MYLECNLMGISMSSNVNFQSDGFPARKNGHPMATNEVFLINLCMKMKTALVLEFVSCSFICQLKKSI